jgi:PEP-CTERM motif
MGFGKYDAAAIFTATLAILIASRANGDIESPETPDDSGMSLTMCGYSPISFVPTSVVDSDTSSVLASGLFTSAQPASATSVSAPAEAGAYTLEGDANLDGEVDFTDLALFAPNFGQSTTLGWEAGDFYYDGEVDASDFSAFAPNFGLTGAATINGLPAADYAALDAFAAANGLTTNPVSVPEPGTIGLIVLGIAGLSSRRRRNSVA